MVNKHYELKSNMGRNYNKKEVYGLENEKGEIIETFRLKTTAEQMKYQLKFNKYEKLKVVTLER